jgi:hypothetical protein
MAGRSGRQLVSGRGLVARGATSNGNEGLLARGSRGPGGYL